MDALHAVVKAEILQAKDEIDDESLMKHKIAQFTAEAQVEDSAQLKLVDETKTISNTFWFEKGNLSNLINVYSFDDDRYNRITQDYFD